MNVIARLKFELAYSNVAVLYISRYTIGTYSPWWESNNFKVSIYLIDLLWAGWVTGSIFKRNKAELHCFSSLKLVALRRLKKPVCPTIYFLTVERTNGFVRFPLTLALSEKQTALLRILNSKLYLKDWPFVTYCRWRMNWKLLYPLWIFWRHCASKNLATVCYFRYTMVIYIHRAL